MNAWQRMAFYLLCGLPAAAAFLLFPSSNPSNVESNKGAAMSFTLTSSRLNPGETIPRQYTCDGDDISPPLRWTSAPAGTKSFSLVAEDPDAPGGTFVHWVLYDLPSNTQELPENLPKEESLSSGARQGRNGFGNIGYGGPCPPPGKPHRYYFRLYALDVKTNLATSASRGDLDRAMKSHIVAKAELMGRYKR